MDQFISPARQWMNLMRYIGDEVSTSGEPIDLQSVPEEIGIHDFFLSLFRNFAQDH